ncbi:hypothetical protein [Salibacterium lacus]|uniref:Uncharacterized protein n=1 Tax=Salibacterium lacus TaxID=1898109 RepID=A0ABW5T1F3_9BACI
MATKTIELPELTRKEAELVEELRQCYGNDFRMICRLADFKTGEYDRYNLLRRSMRWSELCEEDGDRITAAITNGYTIEKSPEDKLREYYGDLVRKEIALERAGNSGSQFRQGYMSVESTLDILGITIPGVNAPAETEE